MIVFFARFFIVLSLFLGVASKAWTEHSYSYSSNWFDIRLFYPVPVVRSEPHLSLSNARVGVNLSYQFKFQPAFGPVLDFSMFVIPVKQGSDKANFFEVGGLAGVYFDPLNRFAFAPRVLLLSGATLKDLGALAERDTSFPMGLRVAADLIPRKDPFEFELATLTLSATYFYYFSQPRYILNNFFDIGIGLRGTF